MAKNKALPGFDRLSSICRQYQLPLELAPPLVSAPKAGDLLFGSPVDPLLIALYQHVGVATFGRISLLRPDSEPQGLIPWNTDLKRDDREPFRSILVFAWEPGFAYYYGTVPSLADASGLQPVVFAKFYPGETSAVPVASNIDRFFDLYSRFLELMVVDAEYVETGLPGIIFPWSVRELIVTDRPLMALAQEDRFSHLIEYNEGARDWVAGLVATRPH